MIVAQWKCRGRDIDANGEYPAGCSKRSDFSPAQPWRSFHPPALSLPRQTLYPWTRLVPSKAAANFHFLRGGWDDPNCAAFSPATNWHAETRHQPERGPSDSQYLYSGSRQAALTARIERPPFHRGGSASKKGTWPLPPHPSEAARCASTGIVPATLSLFSILL